MATPFDHLEQFKSLSPEVQGKIVERFNTLPEDDRHTIMGKINTPMSARGTEGPGLQNVSLTPLQKTAMEEQGPEEIATGLVGKGFDPKLAAAAGTAFRMIPEALMALPGFKGGKAAVEGAEVAGKKLAETGIGKAIRYTGEKEVARISEKIAELPLKQTAKSELAKETLTEAGKGIGKAEKALNIGQSASSASTRRVNIDSPEAITKFADRAAQLANRGAEKLGKVGNPETLQFYRKTAEDALKKGGKTLSNETRNKLYQIEQTFGEAIGNTKEGKEAGFDSAMSTYKEIQEIIKRLPAEAKKEKQLLQVALVRAQNEAKKQARTRKLAGAGAVAAGVALAGRKAVNTLTGGN